MLSNKQNRKIRLWMLAFLVLQVGGCDPKEPILAELKKSEFLGSIYVSEAECQNMYSSPGGHTTEGDKIFQDLAKEIPAFSLKPCPDKYEGRAALGRCVHRGNTSVDPSSLIEVVCYMDSCRQACIEQKEAAMFVPAPPISSKTAGFAVFGIFVIIAHIIVSRAKSGLPAETLERVKEITKSLGKISLFGVVAFLIAYLSSGSGSFPFNTRFLGPGFLAFLLGVQIVEYQRLKAAAIGPSYLRSRLIALGFSAVGYAGALLPFIY